MISIYSQQNNYEQMYHCWVSLVNNVLIIVITRYSATLFVLVHENTYLVKEPADQVLYIREFSSFPNTIKTTLTTQVIYNISNLGKCYHIINDSVHYLLKQSNACWAWGGMLQLWLPDCVGQNPVVSTRTVKSMPIRLIWKKKYNTNQ